MCKFKKKKFFWGGGEIFFFGGGGVRGEGSGWGGQGGCDRRIEVFGKIHKNKNWGGGGGGVVGLVEGGGLVDVNEELKFL